MKSIKYSSFIIFFCLISHSFGEIEFKYIGKGVGGQLGFVATEEQGGTFGFGFHGIAEVSLGTVGNIQFYPGIGFWFKKSEKKVPNTDLTTEYTYRQIAFNLFDVKYLIPVAQTLPIRPYGGIGLAIVVDGVKEQEKIGDNVNEINDKNDALGLNLFGGLDIPISDILVPSIEARFTVTKNWALKVMGGATFKF